MEGIVYAVEPELNDGERFGYNVVRRVGSGSGWRVANYSTASAAALVAVFLTKMADEEKP